MTDRRFTNRTRGSSCWLAIAVVAMFQAMGTFHIGAALAQGDASDAYPVKPIRVIVPFSPGGSTDSLARHVKREIEQRSLLPQPLVIVNMEGAGSAIGSRHAKNARPDGYTLMVLNEAIITSKYWGSVEYGPDAFESIAATGEAGTVLTVRDDSPFADLGEMLQAAKERPREITAAVAMGTPSHFAALGAQAALPGAELQHAQVGGGAHRFHQLKGGHVDLTTFSTDEFRRFRTEGLRGLAYLGAERNKDLPKVPTALEQGFDIQRSITLYWWAPKGTPADRLQAVADALEAAMDGENLRERLAANSVEPLFVRGDALQKRLQRIDSDIRLVAPPRGDNSNGSSVGGVGNADDPAPNMVLWTLVAIGVFATWSAVESRFVESRAASSDKVDSLSETAVATAKITDAKSSPGAQPLRVFAAIGTTTAFVLTLSAGWGPLWLLIGAFVLSCGLFLGAAQSHEMLISLLVLTVVLAAGFHFLMIHVLKVFFVS